MTGATHHPVLIVGGGAAGITVAASLRRRAADTAIAIIEPATTHWYQPAFTLVGGGVCSLDSTRRDESRLIPPGVTWVRDSAVAIEPDANTVRLAGGDSLTYDWLVVCPGLELDFGRIEGLSDTLGRNGVCSNYSPQHVEYTWTCLQGLSRGQSALFTQPPLPFKCPGAPQKIAYLAADHLRRRNALSGSTLRFLTHAPGMFGVPIFSAELAKIADRYGIDKRFQHNLVAVDGGARKATFEIAGGPEQGSRVTFDFDLLHVTPPQRPPEFVRASPLANAAGFVDVHQHSLQHVKWKNVFSLGDAASTPNSKTAAAVRKQAPVVVRNLLHLKHGGTVEEGYDGYASCPLTTAYGKVLMAEFIYGGKVTPTLPLDPRRERASYWWIKTTGLPIMYWDYMLRGYEWFLDHDRTWQERNVPG